MGLQQDVLQHPVSELELREAVSVPASLKVRQAVTLMTEKQLGCVVVVEGAGRILGTFSERQLCRLLAAGPAALDRPLSENLAPAWVSVRADEPIARVLDIMASRKLRFVVVVDDQGRPVGLSGQKSLMEYIVEHFPRQVKVQAMDSKLYMDQREGG